MRRGLLRKYQPANGSAPVSGADLSRALDDVRDAFEKVAADHDVVSSPVARLVIGGAIPAGTAIAVYSGPASQTVMLPPASAQGSGVGMVLQFINAAPVAVTLAPSRGDTLNSGATLSVAAGVRVALASDGAAAWYA